MGRAELVRVRYRTVASLASPGTRTSDSSPGPIPRPDPQICPTGSSPRPRVILAAAHTTFGRRERRVSATSVRPRAGGQGRRSDPASTGLRRQVTPGRGRPKAPHSPSAAAHPRGRLHAGPSQRSLPPYCYLALSDPAARHPMAARSRVRHTKQQGAAAGSAQARDIRMRCRARGEGRAAATRETGSQTWGFSHAFLSTGGRPEDRGARQREEAGPEEVGRTEEAGQRS